jgi:hypothetical protein
VDAVTEYAMQTPNGAWRVDVVKRGGSRWYRLVNGDTEPDWLSIAAVQRILGEDGIEIADLEEVTDKPSALRITRRTVSPRSCRNRRKGSPPRDAQGGRPRPRLARVDLSLPDRQACEMAAAPAQ